MNELIKLENDSYERYEELLIRRDVLRKESLLYENEYVRVFGELIAKAFEAKISCIEKKKIIAYCQAIFNRGGNVDPAQLEEYIRKVMADYNDQLQDILARNEASKGGEHISEYEFRQIKKIYYAIARKIHPDMNPDLEDDETVKDLWKRTVIAYECNKLKELKELQVLVNSYLASIERKHDDIVIPDIEEKIFELNEEIDHIINTDPYTFKYLLNDKEAVEDKKADLKDEIEDYEKYAGELDEVIASFHLERRFS